MLFCPFVINAVTGDHIPVSIEPATHMDLAITHRNPKWQTDWDSNYLSDPSIERFSVKTLEGELIGLGAYQIRGKKAYVFIVYMESAPHSNPTMTQHSERKYYGIGVLLIAYGIKYSIDHGCRGDIVFDAKTEELAKHYETDFHALRIPSEDSGGPKRYMLADKEAWTIFSRFLEEDSQNE